MFNFDSSSGLLASKYLSKKKDNDKEDKLVKAIEELSKTYRPNKLKGVRKLDREKELREQQEQTTLLRKILSTLSGKSQKVSRLPIGKKAVGKGAIAGSGILLSKLLKKGGLIGIITTAFSKTLDNIEKQIADGKGLFVEDLGIKDRLKAFVSTFGEGTVSLINSALSALNIDYQIPEGKITEIVNKVDSVMTSIFDNFVENTGQIGKAIETGLKQVDTFLGKTIDGAFKQFRMLTDVFMKQTKDHKEFIKLVNELNDLEGSKGYVADKDKKIYEEKKKRATELAKKLQSNKDFVKHSGYQFVAQNLLDPAKQAKIQKDMAKNKIDDQNSIFTKAKNVLTGKYVSVNEKIKAEREYEDKYISYIQEKRKKYNITKEEKKKYNEIIQKRQIQKSEEITKLSKAKEEITKLDKAIEINQRLMITDAKNKETYQKNIEEAQKRREELQKQADENLKKIEELKKDLTKLIEITSTQALSPTTQYEKDIQDTTIGTGGTAKLTPEIAPIAKLVRSNEVRNDNYAQTEILKDGAGISFGGYQLTEKGGNLYYFLKKYANTKTPYQSEAKKYLSQFSSPTNFKGNKKEFMRWLRKIGNTKEAKEAQDVTFIEKYYRPALKLANKKGIKDPKAIAHIIDHTLNADSSGANRMLKKVRYGASSEDVAKARKQYYAGLKNFKRFGKSWYNRVDKIQRKKIDNTFFAKKSKINKPTPVATKETVADKRVALAKVKEKSVATNPTKETSQQKEKDSKIVVNTNQNKVIEAINKQTETLTKVLGKKKTQEAQGSNQTVINYKPTKQALNDIGSSNV